MGCDDSGRTMVEGGGERDGDSKACELQAGEHGFGRVKSSHALEEGPRGVEKDRRWTDLDRYKKKQQGDNRGLFKPIAINGGLPSSTASNNDPRSHYKTYSTRRLQYTPSMMG